MRSTLNKTCTTKMKFVVYLTLSLIDINLIALVDCTVYEVDGLAQFPMDIPLDVTVVRLQGNST